MAGEPFERFDAGEQPSGLARGRGGGLVEVVAALLFEVSALGCQVGQFRLGLATVTSTWLTTTSAPAGSTATISATWPVETDHRHTYTAAHAYQPDAIALAIENGVRCIEHGNLVDPVIARRMAELGATMVPTLVTYAAMRDLEPRPGCPSGTWRRTKGSSSTGRGRSRSPGRQGWSLGSAPTCWERPSPGRTVSWPSGPNWSLLSTCSTRSTG